jgi:hypothetical protein
MLPKLIFRLKIVVPEECVAGGSFPECRLAFKSISRKRRSKVQGSELDELKLRVH